VDIVAAALGNAQLLIDLGLSPTATDAQIAAAARRYEGVLADLELTDQATDGEIAAAVRAGETIAQALGYADPVDIAAAVRKEPGVLVQTEESDWFEDPTYDNDNYVDKVFITGSDAGDYYLIGHEVLNASTSAEDIHSDTVQVTHRRVGAVEGDPTTVIILRGLDLDEFYEEHPPQDVHHDEITIDAGAGDDQLIAGLLPDPAAFRANQVISARAVDDLTLIGGEGDDRIVGTPFADTIRYGTGSDIVTGNGGVDFFDDSDDDALADTLIEARDLNFTLSDTTLTVASPELTELETVGMFEVFRLVGGAHDNSFALVNFTKEAHLDGSEGSDTFVLELSGLLTGRSETFVSDSGTISTDNDTVEIRGGDQPDTLHLDDDTSIQQILRKTEGSFRLTYNGEITGNIEGTVTLGAAEIEARLRQLSSIGDQPGDVSVSGSGTEESPWIVKFGEAADAADRNVEGKLFHLGVEDDIESEVATVRVARATVTRLEADVAAALLEGRPDVDALFGPANETQVFHVLEGATGTFRLRYNDGPYSTPLQKTGVDDADRLAIHVALDALGLQTEVRGTGTARDPWRVKIVGASGNVDETFRLKDDRGNYFRLEAENTEVVTPPTDVADAAATTRASISLNLETDLQRVYYDRTAENVVIHGGESADTFIADDSMAALTVYGDAGEDNFLIGRVLKTTRVTTPSGETIEVIDGAEGVTAGVRFNAAFFGGDDNDYFEVNHNIGALQLFGEAGDDMFFMRSQLTNDPDVGPGVELGGGQITAGAGDLQNEQAPGEKDVLINYLQNNRVEIFGGSGFDTLVVAGTSLADQFYVFTDNEGRQYVYGAGLKLEGVSGVERLALVTGAGDDEVYLYGLVEELTLLLNLGSGNDRVIVGGEDQQFQVTYPEASSVYTVQQQVMRDVLQGQELTYNDVVFKRHDWSLDQPKIEAAFQQFYKTWLNEEDPVVIDRDHWRLLEANLAVALKLFAQGVDKSRNAPVRRTPLNPFEFKWFNLNSSLVDDNDANTDVFERQLLDANAQASTGRRYSRYSTLSSGRLPA